MHTYFAAVATDVQHKMRELHRQNKVVKAPRWQGVDVSSKPDMETFELLNYSYTLWLPDEDLEGYGRDIEPDLPWADNHFEERVCGFPLNPGTQWRMWRLGHPADDFREKDGRFNHNYMERLWPKYAQRVPPADTIPLMALETLDTLQSIRGIRYEYGDLNDVVDLLVRDPMTRQAFIPLFFPEDTGVAHNGRTPCTLGYHLILRDGTLHMVYYLRSCDVVNHWRNDTYMAIRLLLWFLQELRGCNDFWNDIGPGTLTVHITSLHLFRGTAHKFL